MISIAMKFISKSVKEEKAGCNSSGTTTLERGRWALEFSTKIEVVETRDESKREKKECLRIQEETSG